MQLETSLSNTKKSAIGHEYIVFMTPTENLECSYSYSKSSSPQTGRQALIGTHYSSEVSLGEECREEKHVAASTKALRRIRASQTSEAASDLQRSDPSYKRP